MKSPVLVRSVLYMAIFETDLSQTRLFGKPTHFKPVPKSLTQILFRSHI